MYEQHFGLSAKPFQLSPDASFFYPSKEHKRALSFLQYGLSQADGFIVITGNVGTGKTTLVQTLLRDLDQSQMAVATLVTSNLDEEDLLKFLKDLDAAALSYISVRRCTLDKIERGPAQALAAVPRINSSCDVDLVAVKQLRP